MTARDEILRAARARSFPAAALPDLGRIPVTTYDDPTSAFIAMLETSGGRAVRVTDRAAAERELARIEAYAAANKICSTVPGVGRGDVDLASVTDPRELADVDYAVLEGSFGVAENGAVWVDAVEPRAIYFICQHLALVVPADEIVQHLPAAYERLDFSRRSFGLFLCGPSKTADIEQSLVIGAHGARSLTVFLIQSP